MITVSKAQGISNTFNCCWHSNLLEIHILNTFLDLAAVNCAISLPKVTKKKFMNQIKSRRMICPVHHVSNALAATEGFGVEQLKFPGCSCILSNYFADERSDRSIVASRDAVC